MPAGNDFDNQQQKQRAQYMNMRAAQIAEKKAGQETQLGSGIKAKGSGKQLIATIVGIVCFFLLLIVLSALHVI